MERAKKSLFDSDVASKLESSFGTGVWVKASFAYTARTICLRLPYIVRWWFLQFEVAEVVWRPGSSSLAWCFCLHTSEGRVACPVACRCLILAACRKRSVVRTTINPAPESVLEKIASFNPVKWNNENSALFNVLCFCLWPKIVAPVWTLLEKVMVHVCSWRTSPGLQSLEH